MSVERIEPVDAAREIWRELYAGSRVIFLAGSVLRGEATPTSDLDIVVVYERLPNAHRESFIYAGWPVEAFVHDPETLNYFLCESDAPQGRPVLATMMMEGREIPAASEFSRALKRMASRFVEAGPPLLSEQDLRRMRYGLTDAVDDIRHPRNMEELVASGTELYTLIADFYLRSQGLWSASRKAIPRRLDEVNAEFAAQFARAFESLFVHKRAGAVINLAAEILEPFGGFLFDGFRDDAAKSKRQTLDRQSESD